MNLSDASLATLIDERYRKRGKEYFSAGMVELISVTATKITAKCAGTRLYKTALKWQNRRLSGECSCPAFESFGPCKHMAAVAYAAVAHNRTGYTPSETYRQYKKEHEALEKYLMKKSKTELTHIIMQMIEDDPDLQHLIGWEGD